MTEKKRTGGGRRKLPERKDLSVEQTWDLSPLYVCDEAWEKDFGKVSRLLKSVQAFRGRLGEGAAVLAEAYAFSDKLERLLEKLYVYAHLRADEDTASSSGRSRLDRIHSVCAEIGGETAWFEPEILALSKKKLRDYLLAPECSLYRRSLSELLRSREHTLSAHEERLLGMASDPLSASSKIFGQLNNADMRFPRVKGESGESEELTHGNYIRFLESGDRRIRSRAFRAMFGEYAKLRHTFAAILDGSVRTHVFNARIRNFPSARAAALHPDNVPEEVYDNLISAVHEGLPFLQNYLRLRKKVLGLRRLDMYDLYNPMVPSCREEYSWPDAGRMVRAAMRPLGKSYCDALEAAFRDRWIDVPECRGKRSGAYSSGCYDSPPYVLMNFNGTLNDVFTLAHELGHSMHSHFSRCKQPYHYADYRIFVAEVASTTAELLLHHHLIAESKSPEMKAYLLNHLLDEFRGTVFRQTMFAEFEHHIHSSVEAGQPITADSLDESYRKLNELYYSPAVEADPRIAAEWARIPHFHYNYYVYKYATGFSAAVALAKGILSGEKDRLDAYLAFLESGDSKDVLDILRDAGVDLADPAPVRDALKLFADTVEELDVLTGSM